MSLITDLYRDDIESFRFCKSATRCDFGAVTRRVPRKVAQTVCVSITAKLQLFSRSSCAWNAKVCYLYYRCLSV